MNALKVWFDGRSPRERRLLLVMVALAIVTLVWGAIIVPVRNGLSSSRERYTDAVVRLGEAQAGLAQVKALQRRAAPLSAPLADVVRARADAAGFALASLDVEAPGRIRTSIATARAGALMQWIAGLEADGVLVDSLSVSGNGAGSVTAQMTLRTRGN
ncbi:type II secretion system protein GspM [Sphingomonas endophytica]|uniref:General secretion pathway protein GspM n=1 Tax=Sphingomonas endophytica TaxID=869719 RepID=A0A147I506_9SPHN|nr:type II secretion system protein GspM [Sphingomonas endophytica]KTT73630.1 general secretion pathway protein GspM [Sphingomonas endophytica]